MPRQTQDREDLLAEASAMPQRGEILVSGHPQTVFVGFRRGGEASWYFTPDYVVQLDTHYRVRRLFLEGHKYAGSGGQLYRLAESTVGGRIRVARNSVAEEDAARIMNDCHRQIQSVERALREKLAEITEAVPSKQVFGELLEDWLSALPTELHVARTVRLSRAHNNQASTGNEQKQ